MLQCTCMQWRSGSKKIGRGGPKFLLKGPISGLKRTHSRGRGRGANWNFEKGTSDSRLKGPRGGLFQKRGTVARRGQALKKLDQKQVKKGSKMEHKGTKKGPFIHSKGTEPPAPPLTLKGLWAPPGPVMGGVRALSGTPDVTPLHA